MDFSKDSLELSIEHSTTSKESKDKNESKDF